MINIENYILEKLVIGKNIIHKRMEFDPTDEQMVYRLLCAGMIYLFKYRAKLLSLNGMAKYSIKRSQLNYQEIIEIFNDYYDYTFRVDDFTLHGKFYNYMKKTIIPHLDKLINMKRVNYKYEDVSYIFSGYDMYWKEYKPWQSQNEK